MQMAKQTAEHKTVRRGPPCAARGNDRTGSTTPRTTSSNSAPPSPNTAPLLAANPTVAHGGRGALALATGAVHECRPRALCDVGLETRSPRTFTTDASGAAPYVLAFTFFTGRSIALQVAPIPPSR